MGLDMYLKKRNKTTDECEELIYWRKANQIRAWIVKNAGYPYEANLIEFPLSKEILENLKMDCDAVLANPDLARQLIPTSRGFFFGSVEYDEGYFDDIRFTAERLQDVLENTDFVNNEVFYLEWY